MAKPLDYQRALVSSILSTMAKNRRISKLLGQLMFRCHLR
jgi:hypothetical protein